MILHNGEIKWGAKGLNDKEFLQWIHDRIVNVYGESRYVDFLYRLREIIERTKND